MVQDFRHSRKSILITVSSNNIKLGARGFKCRPQKVVQDFFHQQNDALSMPITSTHHSIAITSEKYCVTVAGRNYEIPSSNGGMVHCPTEFCPQATRHSIAITSEKCCVTIHFCWMIGAKRLPCIQICGFPFWVHYPVLEKPVHHSYGKFRLSPSVSLKAP